MPTTSYWTALLIGLIAGGAITAGCGYLLGFRRVQRGTRTQLVPELDRRPLRQRITEARRRWRSARARLDPQAVAVVVLVAAMAAVVVYGQVQMARFTAAQRACNAEFQRTIIERADIGGDDNKARKDNDQAVADLIGQFLDIPPGAGDSRERTRGLLEAFQRQFNDNNIRQDANERKRVANQYPRC